MQSSVLPLSCLVVGLHTGGDGRLHLDSYCALAQVQNQHHTAGDLLLQGRPLPPSPSSVPPVSTDSAPGDLVCVSGIVEEVHSCTITH